MYIRIRFTLEPASIFATCYCPLQQQRTQMPNCNATVIKYNKSYELSLQQIFAQLLKPTHFIVFEYYISSCQLSWLIDVIFPPVHSMRSYRNIRHYFLLCRFEAVSSVCRVTLSCDIRGKYNGAMLKKIVSQYLDLLCPKHVTRVVNNVSMKSDAGRYVHSFLLSHW